MKSNHALKEIGIRNRTCYYFNKIIKFEDFDLNDILIEEKSYKIFLV